MPTPAPASTRSDPAVLSLIGNTPLVEITRLDTGRCRLFVELESEAHADDIRKAWARHFGG
jgi:cystathionine beta-synthase